MGSKGKAISRSPQRAEHPCGVGGLRWNLRRRPQTAKSPFLNEIWLLINHPYQIRIWIKAPLCKGSWREATEGLFFCKMLHYAHLGRRGRRPLQHITLFIRRGGYYPPAATRCHPRTRRFLSGFLASLENDGERKRRREGSRVAQMLLCNGNGASRTSPPTNV